MHLRILSVLSCIALFAGCVRLQPGHTIGSAPAPLIERTKLFGGVSRQFTRISPDGQWLSWLAPHDGVMNLWIAPVTTPEQPRVLTDEKTDRVSNYVWSPDSASLFYTQDRGGNQNFVLNSITVAGGPARALTPTENTRAQIVAVSRLVKDRILVSLNNRDRRWQDLYSLEVRSGQLSLVLRNDGYSNFIADPRLVVRAAIRRRSDGGADIYGVDSGQISTSPFESIPYEDVRTTFLVGYSSDGQTLYWRDSRGRDTAALVAQDARTGEKKVLGADPRADVVGTTAHPMTGQIDAYEVNPLRSEWTGLTAQTRRDLERLASHLDGDIEINARTDADDRWVVLLKAGDWASTAVLYERESGRITQLSESRDDLKGAPLGKTHAVSIRSRDGLTQAAYLTLPSGSDRNGDGRPGVPLPLVLFVHGGPWERTDFGYQPNTAFLANRGYAVLAPNFRASTGFGKAFIAAGDGEWGAKMLDDLVDAVDWAISQGIASRDKVAIYGGSYGGYAVLAALAFTPEKFACGVDLFGTSDLRTQVESDAARNEFRRAEYYRRMGDPTSEAGRALLAERSPLTRADAIVRPLLVAQGTTDPQVKKIQSDQMVAALRSHGATVTYLIFSGEGHGFTKPENVIALRAVEEQFLAQCLGGRTEPFGQSLRNSSLTVPHGAGFVEGLEEALAR
jgi:dipeptidyl aminopeptidase/acylaminoacyl peptidase